MKDIMGSTWALGILAMARRAMRHMPAPVAAGKRLSHLRGLAACMVLAAGLQSAPAFAQFTCGDASAQMWLSQEDTLYRISTTTNPFTYTRVGTSNTYINALGYSAADNYIYGLRELSTTLFRMGTNGVAVSQGTVSGLPSSSYISGGMNPAGTILYVLNYDNSTNRMYAINIANRSATTINLSRSVQIADVAWADGYLYSVERSGQLIRINPTNGTVTNVGSLNGVSNGNYFGGLFSAPNGFFGVLNNGGFYGIDLDNGQVTLLSNAPASSYNDGTNCPTANITFGADLSITKTNTPASGSTDLTDDTYTPGVARTYRIVVRNSGPFGAQNVTVSDPLPAGITTATWTCGSPTGGAVCGAASGTGSINDTGADLPNGGTLTYQLTFTVPTTFTGDLVNTATVTPGTSTSDTNPLNNSATDSDHSSTGNITIIKDAVPNNAQDFAFTTTGSGLTNFSLDDDANATLSNTRSFINLTPRTYSVTETAVAGWNLSGLTCEDPDNGTTVDLSARRATIDLDAGETITCTYTNTQQGSIVIVKDAVPNNAQDFTFTTTGTGLSGFSLDDDADASLSNTRSFTNLAPGTYSVTETALAGWNLSGLTCTDPDNGTTVDLGTRTATIDLDAGETVTCTYTNTRATQLTLIKTVTNDNGGTQPATAWTLSASGPTNISGATGSAAVTNAAVNPGTYTLSESAAPTGYTASTYSCVKNGGAAVASNSITLVAGDTATCTINNDDTNQTDVSITKAASVEEAVRGDEVTFTLVVRNLGVAAAHGTVVRDPSVAGLDCTAAGLAAPTCSVTGGASCPAPLTASGLQSGIAIPTLPNGGAVTIGLTCRVVATGLP